MNLNAVKSELKDFIKLNVRSRRLVLCKSDSERESLLRPPAPSPATKSTPQGVAAVSLQDELALCARCESVGERKPPYGTGENGVMVILNAPKLIAPGEKKLLKGESVELMTKMLRAIELEPARCYITNIIKCEPDVHARPSTVFTNCRPFLEREIDDIKPLAVLIMGEMTPLKRLVASRKDIRWFNCEHPVTLIRNPDQKKKAWNTLKLMRAYLDDTAGPGIPPGSTGASG